MVNTDEAGNDTPRVFVSYTHDSDAHKALVLEFATFLRSQGIDAELDQWFTDRRRDWYAWMLELARRADFIVVVASPVFRQVGDGNVGSGENRGAQAEASLLREPLHSDRETWVRKLLPVVLPGYTPDDIPLFLQPRTADHYSVTTFSAVGAVDLLRVLTDQPSNRRPPLGPRPVLPTITGRSIPDTTAGTGSISQSGGGQQVANTGIVGGDFRVDGSRP